jgi:hypothetical protein
VRDGWAVLAFCLAGAICVASPARARDVVPVAETSAAAPDPGEIPPVDISKPRPPGRLSIALYGARWTDVQFKQIPDALIHGRARLQDSSIVAGVVNWRLKDFSVGVPFTRYRMAGFSWEAEGQLIKHSGLQDHWEATGALVARTGEFALPFHSSLSVTWGNGLSYAFEHPDYERGDGRVRGRNAPQLLYHMSLEADVTPGWARDVSVFFRIHHRSGVYGHLAATGSGSNFIGFGIRYRLQ